AAATTAGWWKPKAATPAGAPSSASGSTRPAAWWSRKRTTSTASTAASTCWRCRSASSSPPRRTASRAEAGPARTVGSGAPGGTTGVPQRLTFTLPAANRKETPSPRFAKHLILLDFFRKAPLRIVNGIVKKSRPAAVPDPCPGKASAKRYIHPQPWNCPRGGRCLGYADSEQGDLRGAHDARRAALLAAPGRQARGRLPVLVRRSDRAQVQASGLRRAPPAPRHPGAGGQGLEAGVPGRDRPRPGGSQHRARPRGRAQSAAPGARLRHGDPAPAAIRPGLAASGQSG